MAWRASKQVREDSSEPAKRRGRPSHIRLSLTHSDVHVHCGAAGTSALTGQTTQVLQAQARDRALSYLKAKFPDVDEQAFRTDYTGEIFPDVIDMWSVAQAADIEAICATCTGDCKLSEAVKSRNSRPVISVSHSPRGYSFLEVGRACGLGCKFPHLTEEFRRMFSKSGIDASYQSMTFNAYQCSKSDKETLTARCAAMKASKEQSCLILAGNPGTGKTHLAVAIAIRAMEQGRQALFRLVSAMLDEIQAAIRENGDYDGLMRTFKTVPCLVLDDLGHENMTAARASYLHQIIDYRYVKNLQTIVTTNARTPDELCQWCGREFVAPMLSRLMGHGSWSTLANVKDRRLNNAS